MTFPRLRSDAAAPLAIGLWSAAIALAPSLRMKLALAAPVLAVVAIWLIIQRSQRWMALFFLFLLLTPPLPLPLGDSGVHLSPIFAALGLLVGLLRMNEWRTSIPPITVMFGTFLAVLLASLSFAALYSGPELALRSLFRVGLFAIAVYVFAWAAHGPRDTAGNPMHFARFLFGLAIIAALFACADFYFQIPAPAGFEEQFVWLDTGVFRRAQGLFYEASTLGNFCAFFLVMAVVGLFRPRAEIPCSRRILVAGGLIFVTALILSYSRASMVAVLAACAALVCVRRARFGRLLAISGLTLIVAATAVRFAVPSFSANYWTRIQTSFEGALVTPNGVLTGRLATWAALGDFIAEKPWHAIFGIGYKTLPYSKFAGTEIIADNTYLSLLVETGIIGLIVFLALNFQILRSGLRASRSTNPRAAFLGEWIFCFWVGEMVQMLSGDLITYWRVLPVYFWVLGSAIREADANP